MEDTATATTTTTAIVYQDLLRDLEEARALKEQFDAIRWDDEALLARFNATFPDMAFNSTEDRVRFHKQMREHIAVKELTALLQLKKVEYLCNLVKPRVAYAVAQYKVPGKCLHLSFKDCEYLKDFENEIVTQPFYDEDDATYLLDSLPLDMRKQVDAIRRLLECVGPAAYSHAAQDKVKRTSDITVGELVVY